MNKTVVIKGRLPGETVDKHLKAYGHLPTTKLCNEKGDCMKKKWFCKEHGMEGAVGKSWCFGCYRINDDTDSPVPHLKYGLPEGKK